MKKVVALCMIVFVVGLALPYRSVSAADTKKESFSDSEYNYQEIAEYVTLWFDVCGYGKHKISNPLELYSKSDEKIAVMFSIDQGGYVIVNLINYDVMEFSLDSCPEVSGDKNIYNGFLEICSEDNNRLYRDSFPSSLDEETDFWIDKNAIGRIGLQEKRDQLVRIEARRGIIDSRQTRNSTVDIGDLSHPLMTWGSGFYCQIDAAAILLRYLYDHNDSGILPYGVTNNYYIQSYLCSNLYLADSPMNANQVVNGGVRVGNNYTLGLNAYFWNNYLPHYGIETYYDFSSIRYLIDSNTPVVCGVSPAIPGSTWGERHAVIVHGYISIDEDMFFMKVNDGNGHNGIYLNVADYYHVESDMWYVI